ncbi:filamentous hemagglutinin outer membrane protein [Chondrocystis sp. NIES-4102]|nr:filamentous hemagglutinin outer membrane protein [Chondrocystis sp. NIES-4102]
MKTRFCFPLSFATCITASLFYSLAASAQVTSDGTTGTVVNNNGNNFEIDAGTRSGDNLFHSFGEFSIPTGGSAVFNNDLDVSNILSRVTGGNISQINGLIQAQGSANLFLINPAGIIFGTSADLNIGGSFYGSTADSILFEDGEFSAVNNLNQPTLTINAPIGLNLRDNPAGITLRGNENATDLNNFAAIGVQTGEGLNLIGGDIQLDNAIILAIDGNITLGGLQSSGTININENGGLNFPNNVAQGNISLDTSGVSVRSATDGAGGTINLIGNNININSSLLEGGIVANSVANSGFADAQAGDINLNARGIIDIRESRISNIVDAGGIGNAGDINIETGSLSLSNSKVLSSVSAGAVGKGGNITINADNLSLSEASGIAAETSGIAGENQRADAGNITINVSNSLQATGGSLFQLDTFGQGDAGNITINGEDATITLDGSAISSSVRNYIYDTGDQLIANGKSGAISITADSLSLSNGAQIKNNLDPGVIGEGNNINLSANSISLSNASNILSGVDADAVGKGGNININADKLSLSEASTIATTTLGIAGENGRADAGDITVNVSDSLQATGGSYFQSDTFGQGDAGKITINAESANVTLDGTNPNDNVSSGIFSSVRNFIYDTGVQLIGNGKSGEISITADSLSLSNGAQIRNTLDPGVIGEGNNINLTANSISLSNASGILSGVDIDAIGKGGNITINTDNLSLSEASGIATDTSGIAAENGRADAGDITVNVSNSLQATGGSVFQSDTFGQGDAGKITINGETANVTLDGINPNTTVPTQISSSVRNFIYDTGVQLIANGKSGEISITADSLSLTNGAQIRNSLDSDVIGEGNNINVSADNLSLNNNALIFSGTFSQGNGGDITLNTSDRLTLAENSTISTQVVGTNASGGNITINAKDGFIVTPESQNAGNGNDIVTNSPEGEGGNIRIEAQGVLGIQERDATPDNGTNDIDASGTVDGDININAPSSDAIEGATKLPNNPVEAGETVAQACVSNRGTDGNNLVITGKGGIPNEIIAPLVSDSITINGQATSAAFPVKEIKTSKGNIIAAQGIAIKKDGSIVLTAYPTNNSRIPQIPNSCGKS